MTNLEIYNYNEGDNLEIEKKQNELVDLYEEAWDIFMTKFDGYYSPRLADWLRYNGKKIEEYIFSNVFEKESVEELNEMFENERNEYFNEINE